MSILIECSKTLVNFSPCSTFHLCACSISERLTFSSTYFTRRTSGHLHSRKFISVPPFNVVFLTTPLISLLLASHSFIQLQRGNATEQTNTRSDQKYPGQQFFEKLLVGSKWQSCRILGNISWPHIPEEWMAAWLSRKWADLQCNRICPSVVLWNGCVEGATCLHQVLPKTW
jgi:hypothetical protein